ncbi:MAG: BatD family protein [Proteobacteria bacterium]|nr:BatD family protein [Pseudomonadota bacterium]
MKKVRKALIVFFVLYLLTGLTISSCFAGYNNISMTLSLDRKEATAMDSMGMVVKISGVRSNDSWPVVKGLESFDVVQIGSSSRIEVINTTFSSAIEYNYMIQPKEEGTYKIGPAQLTIDGKTITSNTENLTIIKPSRSSDVDRGEIFLSTSLSSNKIYIEEQAVYTLKLYNQGGVKLVSLSLPETEHLILKQIEKPSEYQSVYNGKTYQVLEVRYVLIPSKEGTYGIKPARMSLNVMQPRHGSGFGMFDDPFFLSSGSISKNVASEPLELKVLPLPAKGRPSEFTGMIGTFNMKASLEPAKIKKGESATLAVVVEGHGNVKRIPDLKGPVQQDIKIYADQPVFEESVDSGGIKGLKTMKWALVPEKEGQYEISPLKVSFFDTQKQQYRTIETSPFYISVLPGAKEVLSPSSVAPEAKQTNNVVKKEIKEIGYDILPVHDSIKDLSNGSSLQNRNLMALLLLITPFLIYLLTFLGLKYGIKSDKAMAAVRIKKAAGIIIQQCRKGKICSGDMISELRNYLNNRFGLDLGSLTAYEADNILKSKGVSSETAYKFKDIILELEGAVYTGKGNEICSLAEKIIEIIKKVEKELR